MELVIISPTKKTITSVAWLEIDTTVGNFVIQPGHAPTVRVLDKEKAITYRLTNVKQESVIISAGIVEISPSTATIIMH